MWESHVRVSVACRFGEGLCDGTVHTGEVVSEKDAAVLRALVESWEIRPQTMEREKLGESQGNGD